MHIYSYLALGDLYTIGEAVPLNKSFPYQVVQLLRQKEYNFSAPEILAGPGWTTDELQAAINKYALLPKYDFVTLLVGMNNQEAETDVIGYKEKLEEILKKAIEIVNGKKDHVVMLSIPHHSSGRQTDAYEALKDVDVFNGINKALSIQYKTQYIDLTTGSKKSKNDASLNTDMIVSSLEKEYLNWAKRIVEIITSQLK